MIVYGFLSQIANGEGRTGWSGDLAQGDSILDLGIARKVAGWSTLRKRGNLIENSGVEKPNRTLRWNRSTIAHMWEGIGRIPGTK
jgi:hypothetical protein